MGFNEDLVFEEEIENLEMSDSVNHEDIVDFLQNLPEPRNIEFQVNIANLVQRVSESSFYLEKILEDGLSKDIRFKAFYALQTYYRRNKDLSDLEELYKNYSHIFSDRTMYKVLHSVLLRLRNKPESIFQAIEEQSVVLNEISDNPGIYQAKANTIVQAIEDGIISDDRRDQYLNDAKKAIRNAISIWPDYGKYHVTHGRILKLEGKYEAAREEIEKGIDLEEANKEDYAIRIASFQQHLLKVDFEEYHNELEKQIDREEKRVESLSKDLDDALQGFRKSNLQFLGFFAAILGGVIITMQVATNYPAIQAGPLILIIFGGLSTSFGLFSLIVPRKEETNLGLKIVGVGILILLFGFIILWIHYFFLSI